MMAFACLARVAAMSIVCGLSMNHADDIHVWQHARQINTTRGTEDLRPQTGDHRPQATDHRPQVGRLADDRLHPVSAISYPAFSSIHLFMFAPSPTIYSESIGSMRCWLDAGPEFD